MVAALDSANNLFRVGDMDGALAQYEQVVELAPELPSGWFGIYMVHAQEGNRAAADSAFQRAMELAPNSARPPMVEGHPPFPPDHPTTGGSGS